MRRFEKCLLSLIALAELAPRCADHPGDGLRAMLEAVSFKREIMLSSVEDVEGSHLLQILQLWQVWLRLSVASRGSAHDAPMHACCRS